MKIGIAKDGNQVSQHFGHCEGFQVYDVVDGKIVSQQFVESPGHRPGNLPPFLADQGVKIVIAGGMGGAAQELFNERGVSVIVGAKGTLEDVINAYIKDDLVSSGSVCKEHAHEGNC